MSYDHTKSRVLQWLGIILILCLFGGAYWYLKVYGSTINQSKNDLVTNGLIGMWSFDGGDISGTTAYDRSGNGFDGTIVAAPVRMKGKVGQALLISDTQYVSVADTATLDVGDTADLTLSGWVAGRNASVTNTVIAKRNGVTAADVGYILYMDVSSGKLVFEVSDGTDEYSLTSTEVFTSSQRWIHFVVVWDQDSAANSEIYIDGVANSATDSGTIGNIGDLSNALTFRVGSESDTNNALRGNIDEVRVYNRALSAGEVQSLFVQGGGTKIDSSVSQPQGTGRLDSGLVGYWGLDDGSGTSGTDSSTNGNTGTLTNGPTWTTGQIGGAVNFDGTDDHITAGAPSAVNMTGAMTVSAWIYPETFGGGGGKGRIVDKLGAGATGYMLAVDNVNVASGFAFLVNGGTLSPVLFVGAANSITLNTWQHVTVTIDAGKVVTLYRDGTKKTSTTFSELPGSGANNFVIGGRTTDNARNFDGSIDEVRVYNRALSADEVADLYRLTAPTGVDTNLNGYWSFNGQDMISSTTAADLSGAANTGTLTGSPARVTGKLGQALSFDGVNDIVSVSNASSICPSSITVGTWVKFTALTTTTVSGGATTNEMYILGKENNSGADDAYGFYKGTDHKIRFSVKSYTNYAATSTSVVAGQWYYIAGVYDGSTIKTYINGVLDGTTAYVGGALGCSSSALVFGHRFPSATYDAYLNGVLDETRIYSSALSAAQIQALYAQGGGAKVDSSVSQAQGTGRLDSGLAGYWRLDDGSGSNATDSSTNGTTFVLTGSPTWTTGQIAGAIDLDGSTQYAAVASSDIFEMDGTKNFSLSGWFNRDTATSLDVIFAKRVGTASNNTGYIVYLDATTDKLTFEASDGADEYQMESVSTFTATGWHHFTVVWDESSASQTNLYIDGNQENVTRTGTFTSVGILTNTLSVGIGINTNGDGHFDGKLDEIRLYNRALSADEAVQLYRLATPTGTDTGLKGYWSLNGRDISGTTAYDQSGGGNVGTLTGGPTKTAGKIGQGLDFDGTDDLVSVVDNPFDITDTDDVTVSGWFYRDTATTEDTLVAKRNGILSTNTGYITYIDATNDQLIFEVGDGADEYSLTSTSTFTTAGWHHFAAVWDQDSAAGSELYIDGVADSATDAGTIGSVDAVSGTAILTIGAESDSGNPFDGKLDEIRVYKRALSAAEIAALYNQSR